MRIQLKLIEQDSTVNYLQYIPCVNVRRGETLEIVFQLVQENGQRYIPSNDAEIELSIPRNANVIAAGNYDRTTVDYSIKRIAVKAFQGDDSFWKIPLTSAETQNLVSGGIKVTLTEGEKIRKVELNQAIRVIDGQER